ncbi:MAG: sigma-70 family RNA polymerase sigma factor [Actinomycetota bacterium]|nr:sigma-70 family RNA polymerase sigma factor [Actinomycetota bacterium]
MSPDQRLERLYREEGARLWWALLAYSGDREVASDAVAEAFVQALGRGSAIRSPSAWVWKAAFRIAAGELKRRRGTGGPPGEEHYEMPEPSDVLTALARISERQRAAIVLHYYAGYSLKEVAAITGSAKATVGVHLTRGRRRLRMLLEENDE